MRRTSLLLIVALFVLPGCTTMMADMQTLWSESKRSMKPSASDYEDSSTDEGEEWAFVGEEGRGSEPVEKDPGRFWRKYIMSPQARSIERNLGVE